MSVYRIWHGDSNDRSELGRATAKDIDAVIEYVKTQYLKPDTQFYDIDYQGEDQAYLMINVCKGCEYEDCLQCDPELEMDINREACRTCNKYKAAICEDCEQSEYIEITQDTDAEPEYRTIYGVNEYADLTTDTRPTPYNKQLADAWKQSPEKGIAALTLHTIDTNPKLLKAYPPELIEKHKQTLNQ